MRCGICSSVRYLAHLYCLAVQAGFYGDFASQVRSSACAKDVRLEFVHLLHKDILAVIILQFLSVSPRDSLGPRTNESCYKIMSPELYFPFHRVLGLPQMKNANPAGKLG